MDVNELEKDYVFNLISKSVQNDNLGMFIGSGFSKEICNQNKSRAYSWKELLEQVNSSFGGLKNLFNEGSTYPLIATKIVNSIGGNSDASRCFKYEVSRLVKTNLKDDIKNKYGEIFKKLKPNWIVTTNYDLNIEQCLEGSCFTIGPEESYYKIKGLVPVYHIHGCINNPESIVITNDDYVKTLRFSDYRHERLPFLIKESTVLMIGYSRTDINVLSAIDYSSNIYTNNNNLNNCKIIQLNYTDTSVDKIYLDKEEVIVVNYNDLDKFFTDFFEYYNRFKSSIGKKKTLAENLLMFFNSDDVISFIENKDKRNELIKKVFSLDLSFGYVYLSFLNYVKKTLGYLWIETNKEKNFESYNQILIILLDIISYLDIGTPEFLTNYIIEQFDKISNYVGYNPGQSYSACLTWTKRKSEFPDWLKNKIDKYYGVHIPFNLESLLKNGQE